MRNFLHERASGKLYHFIEFINFYHLVKTNCFTPTDWEKEYNNGKNSMSFSRTGSFHEGFPVLMYSEEEGHGDDWCAIRLTINGDLMNRHSNFKVDGKQYNMKFKPFDYIYKTNNDGDADFIYDNYGVDAKNGKEWMMKSDGYTTSYLSTNHEILDPQGHPYSQAEDRLTTYASKIPNAERYVDRVDILLLTRNFSDYNYNDRLEMYKLITSSVFSNKIHVYTDMKQLERRGEEISGNNLKRILTFKTTNKNMKKKIKLTESQLNKIVKESLNRILSESDQKYMSDDEKRREIISGYTYSPDMDWDDVIDAIADATLIMAQWKNDCFLRMLEDLPQTNKAIYDLIEKIRNDKKNGILNENYSN